MLLKKNARELLVMNIMRKRQEEGALSVISNQKKLKNKIKTMFFVILITWRKVVLVNVLESIFCLLQLLHWEKLQRDHVKLFSKSQSWHSNASCTPPSGKQLGGNLTLPFCSIIGASSWLTSSLQALSHLPPILFSPYSQDRNIKYNDFGFFLQSLKSKDKNY